MNLVAIRSELRCMAPHPLREVNPDKFGGGRTCNRFITALPWLTRWTGRVLSAERHARAGCIPAFCAKCRLYSEYEVTPAEDNGGGDG
jgi:hypothetical protein